MKLKWDESGIKTDLARARGLGSAKEGTEHWTNQRITAIANLPLMLWLIYNIVDLRGASYQEFSSWLAQPVNAILMTAVVISTFYHALLGSQVVVEDYVHNEGFKAFKMIGMKLFFSGAAIACIFSIFKIAFTTGG